MGFLIGLYLSLLACDPEAIFRNAPVIDLIDISPNRVNPYDTVYATVNATNPEEGSLTFQWSVSPERGPFLDPVDSRSVRWIAPTSGGDYVFKVVVSNSYKSTDRTGTVRVIEGGDPLVRIVFPQEDDYFIQMQEIEIIADAVHNNGIHKVQLFVGDMFISEQSGLSSNSYQFTFTPDSSYLGLTEIKVSAIANFTLTQGADSIEVMIEGIVPAINN